ncbi:unnamed protein product [Closterium sp. Yama58-4]|nr:unnamed protein product [Closterium sp. Yama58-4]
MDLLPKVWYEQASSIENSLVASASKDYPSSNPSKPSQSPAKTPSKKSLAKKARRKSGGAETASTGEDASAEADAEAGASTGTNGNSGEGAGAGGGGQAEDPRGGLSEAEWMALAEQLRGEGDALLKEAAEAYERRKESSSDARWLAAVRRSGTAADRVAALTVVIQDDPVANLSNLDALLGGKVTVAGGDAGRRLLRLWRYEECLKERFERFLEGLEEGGKDVVEFVRDKVLRILHALLSSKAEGERRVLLALVNKLGDPSRKVASKASYLLGCLLDAHPNMAPVVVKHVEAFVFRPNISTRARHYAAVFLNHITLSHKGLGPMLARQLIDLYFALFKVVTDRFVSAAAAPGVGGVEGHELEADSALLSALLTGVNRAFRYVAEDDVTEVIETHTPLLFRMVHAASFNLGVQALLLLFQLMAKSAALSTRYYRALYSVLFSPALAKSSKGPMFMALVFKSMKADVNLPRIAAFAKRLLQVALQQQATFACGALLLISQVLKLRPMLWTAILEPEANTDDVEHFVDADKEAATNEDGFIEGKKERGKGGEEGDEEEDGEEEGRQRREGTYDPKQREPSLCHADRACWWELAALAAHVHPTVSRLAASLLSGEPASFTGDPIQDLSLSAFLDRFAEKQQMRMKAAGRENAASAAAVAAAGGRRSVGFAGGVGRDGGKDGGKGEQVQAHDAFFHQFYAMQGVLGSRWNKGEKKGGEGWGKRREEEEEEGLDVDMKIAEDGDMREDLEEGDEGEEEEEEEEDEEEEDEGEEGKGFAGGGFLEVSDDDEAADEAIKNWMEEEGGDGGSDLSEGEEGGEEEEVEEEEDGDGGFEFDYDDMDDLAGEDAVGDDEEEEEEMEEEGEEEEEDEGEGEGEGEGNGGEGESEEGESEEEQEVIAIKSIAKKGGITGKAKKGGGLEKIQRGGSKRGTGDRIDNNGDVGKPLKKQRKGEVGVDAAGGKFKRADEKSRGGKMQGATPSSPIAPPAHNPQQCILCAPLPPNSSTPLSSAPLFRAALPPRTSACILLPQLPRPPRLDHHPLQIPKSIHRVAALCLPMFATWLRLAARQTHVGEAAEKGSAAVILRIVREHGPCNKNVLWTHAEEAGVKSKRHMKLMLRWLIEKNQIRIKCLTHDPSAPHQAGSAGSAGSAGGAAASAAASRGAGSGAFAAAAAARVQPAGLKKRATKHVSAEKEFIYSIAPRYVPPSS